MLAATLPASFSTTADQRVELRVADEVETPLRSDRRRVLPGGIAPHLLAVASVEAEGLPLQRREVDDAVDHARGAGNLAAGVEPPADIARGRVERIEGAVVGADHDVAAPDRGRAVDEVAGPVRPAELAARGAVGVHLPIGRAEVDASVGDGRVRVEGAGAADPRLRRGAPDLLAGARIERVDMRVVGAEIDAVACERDRSLDQPTRVVVPAQVPR